MFHLRWVCSGVRAGCWRAVSLRAFEAFEVERGKSLQTARTHNSKVIANVAIAETIREQSDPVLVIASSDMNHYEDDEVTRQKDSQAIAKILALDPRGLYEVVTVQNISMCGYGPAVAMLTAARQRGASKAELVKYATSGDVSGDRDLVVGYAGVLVS